MSVTSLSAKFTVDSVISNDGDKTYTVSGTMYDGTGFYTAYDVQDGDLFYLDSSPAPVDTYALVTRWRISNVSVLDVFVFSCDMTYLDQNGGEVPVMDNYIGSASFITRPSAKNKFGWIPSPDTQVLPLYFIENARNLDEFAVTDNLSGGGENPTDAVSFVNVGGQAIPANAVAYQSTDQGVILADKSSPLDVGSKLFVATAAVAPGATGSFLPPDQSISGQTNLTPLQPVFLGVAGVPSSTVSYIAGDVVYQLGEATTATSFSFKPRFIVLY